MNAKIQADYTQWLKDNIDKLAPHSHADVQQILDERARPRPAQPGRGAAQPGRGPAAQ